MEKSKIAGVADGGIGKAVGGVVRVVDDSVMAAKVGVAGLGVGAAGGLIAGNAIGRKRENTRIRKRIQYASAFSAKRRYMNKFHNQLKSKGISSTLHPKYKLPDGRERTKEAGIFRSGLKRLAGKIFSKAPKPNTRAYVASVSAPKTPLVSNGNSGGYTGETLGRVKRQNVDGVIRASGAPRRGRMGKAADIVTGRSGAKDPNFKPKHGVGDPETPVAPLPKREVVAGSLVDPKSKWDKVKKFGDTYKKEIGIGVGAAAGGALLGNLTSGD